MRRFKTLFPPDDTKQRLPRRHHSAVGKGESLPIIVIKQTPTTAAHSPEERRPFGLSSCLWRWLSRCPFRNFSDFLREGHTGVRRHDTTNRPQKPDVAWFQIFAHVEPEFGRQHLEHFDR